MIKIPAKQKMNCKMSQKIRNNSSVNQMMEYENLVDPGNERRHDADKESEADDKVFLKQEENTANNTETMNATPDE